jgi:hypothetical protein
MQRIFVAVLLIGVSLCAGCGESIHWFPGNSGTSGGTMPNPPPSGQIVTDVQADTATPFLPYTVLFGNITTSTTTASISVSGDASSQYSKDNGATFTSTAGTVKKGDTVIVRNTSSNFGSDLSISTILNIGGANATYISKTGTLIFPTLSNRPTGSTVLSNTATVPVNLPNGFAFGNSATIAFAADSDASSTMYLNGSIVAAPSPSPINALDRLSFKHTAASAANTTVITKAVLTGSTGTYTVTFKSVTQ